MMEPSDATKRMAKIIGAEFVPNTWAPPERTTMPDKEQSPSVTELKEKR
jgi:hypothetical protein